MSNKKNDKVFVFDQYGRLRAETNLEELRKTGCSFRLFYISADPYRWIIIDTPEDKG